MQRWLPPAKGGRRPAGPAKGLRAWVRPTDVSSYRGVRRGGHIDRGVSDHTDARCPSVRESRFLGAAVLCGVADLYSRRPPNSSAWSATNSRTPIAGRPVTRSTPSASRSYRPARCNSAIVTRCPVRCSGNPCLLSPASHSSGGMSEYVTSRFSASENSRATSCRSCDRGPVSSYIPPRGAHSALRISESPTESGEGALNNVELLESAPRIAQDYFHLRRN